MLSCRTNNVDVLTHHLAADGRGERQLEWLFSWSWQLLASTARPMDSLLLQGAHLLSELCHTRSSIAGLLVWLMCLQRTQRRLKLSSVDPEAGLRAAALHAHAERLQTRTRLMIEICNCSHL